MSRNLLVIVLLLFAGLPAHAVLLSFDPASLAAAGVVGTAKGAILEAQLNDKIFAPHGAVFRVAAHTGGTFAVDDFTAEGPGLTIITGTGFIVEFGTGVANVEVVFGDFKDGGDRGLTAYDGTVAFLRSATVFNQHSDGDALALLPDGELQSVDGTVTTTPLILQVADAPGRISSVWGRTSKFLTTLESIEFDTARVPAPGTSGLLLFVLLGLAARRSGENRRSGSPVLRAPAGARAAVLPRALRTRGNGSSE